MVIATATLDPDFMSPQILFKEIIITPVKGIGGKFISQSDGKGQYGHVVIDIEPTESTVFSRITTAH